MRRVLATSVLWALAMVPVGVIVGLDVRSHVGFGNMTWDWPALAFIAAHVRTWAVLGAIAGAGFAIALMMIERSRKPNTLSVRQAAALGAMVALVLPAGDRVVAAIRFGRGVLAPGFWMAILALVALVGAALGARTLAVARRPVRLPDGDRGPPLRHGQPEER